MNISVRVLSANAQSQIKALQAQVRALEGQLARANATSSSPNAIGGARSRKTLGAWGNQLQWTGRQLQYNWTLPLLFAGAAATKFSLDNEKAMTRVTKVYGDVADAIQWSKKNQDEWVDGAANARDNVIKTFRNELDALGDAFDALSSRYGIQQKQVIETAGAWAAAGASGLALAKSTELSIKASILGDMDLAKATESLIAIQSQYSLSTKELNLTLAELNAIENQTGISMQGLIDGFSRTAGVARESGIDVRYLGAMLAALVPATGSAATAGNSLKTIISRIMAPTKDAADVMREFGVDTSDSAWQASTAMERLDILADHMNGTLRKTADGGYELSDSQKQVVASVLGSRYQMNRFLVLMRELGPEHSYYEKALDATASRSRAFAQATKELNAVLKSNPKRLEIMWYTLQNGLADAIQPLIPYIVYLAGEVAKLAQAFTNLDPSVQKLILLAALMLAAVGPLTKYLGSLATLVWALGRPFQILGGMLGKLGVGFRTVEVEGAIVRRSFVSIAGSMLGWPFRVVILGLLAVAGAFATVVKTMMSWTAIKAAFVNGIKWLVGFVTKYRVVLLRLGGIWTAVIGAIALIIYRFRDQLGKIWGNIVRYFSDSNNAVVALVIRAWNALPRGIQNALLNVVRVIRAAALQVYEWMSYINPWAHHSPSLVENVTTGVARVQSEFGKLRNIKGILKGAYADIKAFGQQAAGFELKWSDQSDDRKKIAKVAPQLLAGYDKLAGRLRLLEALQRRLTAAITSQQRVVDGWQNKLDAANAALDRQSAKLDRLQKKQQKWQDALSEAQDRLQYFASAPIKGMQAMADKIFENEMAQKALRLEMMKMEDAVGTLDDLKGKMDAINGAQELLNGQRADLRSAGAGSEILGAYDDQIAKLDEQKTAYTTNMQALVDMQTELDRLGRKAEELDLQNSLKFDPLTHEIEKAANALKELSFNEIMAGIKQAQTDIDTYTKKLDDATAAVDAQQKVVDALTAARDALQQTLDLESKRLDALKDRYSKVADAISAIRDAMQDAVAAADNLVQHLDKLEQKKRDKRGGGYVSPAVKNFRDAKGGNFAEVGGAGIPIRADWASQADKIKEFTKNLGAETSRIFDSIDPFDPIRKKWGEFKAWLNNAWQQVEDAANDFFSHALDGVDFGGGGSKITDSIRKSWARLVDWFKGNIAPAFKLIAKLFWGPIKDIGKNAWEGIKEAWGQIWPELKKFSDEFDDLGPAIKGFWNLLKVFIVYYGARFLPIFKIILHVIARIVKPAFKLLGDVIENALQIIRGAAQIIIGFFELFAPGHFTEGLKKIGAGIGNVISGLFGGIGQIIWGSIKIIIGAAKGLVEGIVDLFLWLKYVLIGDPIVVDIVNGIISLFHKLGDLAQWVWAHVLKPVVDFFVDAYHAVIAAVKLWWDGIVNTWNDLLALGKWVWDNVLVPILNKIKSLWTDHVRPELGEWKSRIQSVWNVLKDIAGWIWNNILVPIFNKIKSLWTDHVRPELGEWKSRIESVWNVLKEIPGWIWNNLLFPILNKIKSLWTDHVRPELGEWKSRILGAWENLKEIAGWVKNNVMDPIFDAFKDGWNKVKDWMEGAKDLLMKPARGIVNAVISAVNFLIRGLNKVADVLPGFNWNISLIPQLSSGGTTDPGGHKQPGGGIPGLAQGGNPLARRVGGGFRTNGARAIVGEGKANHPEYVIPTDPTYRARARSLLESAASKLGMMTMSVNPRGAGGDTPKDAERLIASGYANYGAPQYGIGGVIGNVGDWISDRWGNIKDLPKATFDYLKDHLKDAVSFIVKPFKNGADAMVNRVDWDFLRGMGHSFTDQVFGWALAADKGVSAGAHDVIKGGIGVQNALAWAKAQEGKPYVWGSVGPDGYDCSGFMSALTNVVQGRPPHSRVGTTATFPWGGFASGVGSFTIGSTNNYGGSGVGHMAGTLGGVNVESRGGYGVIVGSGARGYNDAGFSEIAHLTNAAKGAIVRASRGGSFIRAGEAGRDEAVIPLPRGWANAAPGSGDGGDTYIEFSGAELVFPNITDPNDVETFIENLKSLSGGGQ